MSESTIIQSLPMSVNVCCPNCQLPFGPINSAREARILACGDSYCAQCISNLFLNEHEFPCLKCRAIVIRERTLPPLNKLYYQMQAAAREAIARVNWENPSSENREKVDRFNVDYQAKCLNPFCLRVRYQNEIVSELFCCRQCKYQHEVLYSKP